ncbi:MAG TPA: protein kinase [Candidatus Acidoferrum sp.]|nr:protein kinase [Candidatus Acidoferrum sp.]
MIPTSSPPRNANTLNSLAIKVPNPERITNPEDVEAFLIEARILARLDHPNIVPVHDVGRTEDGLSFVVSKLVEGNDLVVKIGQARPSFRDSAELAGPPHLKSQ